MKGTDPILLAPSILSADFARLGEQVEAAVEGGADLIHVDVMDGTFVPQITIGPLVVEAVRRAADGRVPLDVHLMVEHPEPQLPDFVSAGADWISVHVETVRHLHGTLQSLRGMGVKAGAVLNPATPVSAVEEVLEELDYVLVMSVNPGFGGQALIPSCLDKVRRIREMLEQRGLDGVRVELDGGVKVSNIADAASAGAEIAVAGSAVFGTGDPAANLRALRAAAAGGGG